ncbi:MAG: IS1 family transposase [Cyclobacteriaceae bacterium]|jgi:IS1 family transposase
MNQLPLSKRAQIINLLVEGSSLRATSRIADVSINTVTKLLVEVGKACQDFHYSNVVSLSSKKVQCDEIWSFVYAKGKNVPEEMKCKAGDVWTWTALDSDSKLIISWLVGDRSANTAEIFMKDVASRLASRVKFKTDGHHAYLTVVDKEFETPVDFAQLIEIYGEPTGNDKRYSPVESIGTKKNVIMGRPDLKLVSTSYVERQNLTMRMHMRRFTRLTNAFSKKVENHCHAIALHFVYFNFVKVHKSLRVTPAMEAGLAKKPMTIEDIVNLTV